MKHPPGLSSSPTCRRWRFPRPTSAAAARAAGTSITCCPMQWPITFKPTNFTMLNIEEKTQAVVAALEDVKGQDIQVIDTSKLSSLFERMVIASAHSTPQTQRLAA